MSKIVRLIKLPLTVKGVTVPDADGNFNIYINKGLTFEEQQKAYMHEIIHISNKDFESNENINVLEKRAKYGN